MAGVDLLAGFGGGDDYGSGAVALNAGGTTTGGAGANPFDELEANETWDDSEDVTQYLGHYDGLRSEIGKIEKNAQEIVDAANEYKRATSPDDQKAIMQRVDEVMRRTQMITRAVKNDLTEQKEENDKFAEKKPGSSVVQWRINQINSLTKRFKYAATEFQEELQNYRETLRNEQKRKIKIVDIDNKLSATDVDEITKDHDKASQFIQANLAMTVGDQFLDHLNELEDRLEGMRKIEQSVKELQQMWQELHLLVTHQQEMLDNIEQNVEMTKTYVQSGREQIEKAEAHQKCARKQMCWIFCCAIIVLAIVLGIVIPTSFKSA